MPKTKGFAAKDWRSRCRINTWRDQNRILILKGIPLNTPPTEFEAACRERLSQHKYLRFEWEPPCEPSTEHQGQVALGFKNAEARVEAEKKLAEWRWNVHPIFVRGAKKPRPRRTCSNSTTKTESPTNVPSMPTCNTPFNRTKSPPAAETTKQTATLRGPPLQAPPDADIIDLTASSPPAPARPLANRLSTPVNVPCAAARAVQEASCIAGEAAAAADAAVGEAHAATFRAFTAEAAGDVAAAATAQEEALAADERARLAYGAAATASRIASTYSLCIGPQDDGCRY